MKSMTCIQNSLIHKNMLINLICELKLLQENGAVNNELNIQNTELFKKSNIVRYSAGLGAFKDLTQTPSMRKCNSIQAKNIRKKEKTNE